MSSRDRKRADITRSNRIFSTANLQAKFGIDEAPREWLAAIGYGIVLTVVMLVFAVAVNTWIGRTIHWDWVAGFGFLAFAGLSVGRRARIL